MKRAYLLLYIDSNNSKIYIKKKKKKKEVTSSENEDGKRAEDSRRKECYNKSRMARNVIIEISRLIPQKWSLKREVSIPNSQ